MTNIVTQMYSGPITHHVYGKRQLGGGAFQALQNIAIPILHKIKSGLATMANSSTMRSVVQALPEAAASGLKKAIEMGADKIAQKICNSGASEGTAPPSKFRAPKRAATSKRASHKRKRRRRSRVDDILGDNSY